MTPGYTLHTGTKQPKNTDGKVVKYRLFNSDRFGVAKANELNWLTEGPRSPSEAGRIFEYQVIQ